LVLAAIFFVGSIISLTNYEDIPFFYSSSSRGREKNNIALVVAGLLAQEYGKEKSVIDIQLQKHFFPDSRIRGEVTTDSIDIKLDLLLSTSKFTAYKDVKNELIGEVIKNEFDWEVVQIDKNRYRIGRRLFRFDRELILEIRDGKVSGMIIRNGLYFDWEIEGTISEDGFVDIEIDGILNLGVKLVGKIAN